jgi:hypothetical protein
LTVAKLLVSPTKGLAVGKRQQQRVESNQKRKIRVLIYF